MLAQPLMKLVIDADKLDPLIAQLEPRQQELSSAGHSIWCLGALGAVTDHGGLVVFGVVGDCRTCQTTPSNPESRLLARRPLVTGLTVRLERW